MRRKRLLLLLLALPLAYFAGDLLLGRILPRLRNEAVYQGRATSEWLTALEEERAGARTIFNHEDPAALPVLLQLLRADDARVRSDALITIRNLAPAVEQIEDPIREALEQETEPNNVLLGGRVLARGDPQAADRVLTHLVRQHPTPRIRGMTIAALLEIGSRSPLTVQTLEEALHDEAEFVRLRAAHALWHLTHDRTRVVPVLVQLCTSTSEYVLVFTADCLRAIGPEAADAAPALAGLVENHPGHVRRRACWALADIHAKDPAVVPALLVALRDDFADTRQAAALALSYSDAVEAVAALRETLHDAKLRTASIEGLGRLGARAREAVPSLRELLRDADPRTRLLTARALEQIGATAGDPRP
jgi:HEAT repeat protein